MESAVYARRLAKSFRGRKALENVDLVVENGELACLYGPPEAGKSTLLRILAGEVRPSGGEARILGKDPFRSRSSLLRKVGFLPAHPVFYDWMRINGCLAFLARAGGLGGSRLAGRIGEVLERVGLNEERARVGDLTEEGRCRLGLAQALLLGPPLLLLDNPLASCAGESRSRLETLLLSLRKEGTVLFSSNTLGPLEEQCDSLAVLDRGKLLLQEKLGSLRQRFQEPALVLDLSDCPAAFLAALQAEPWLEEAIPQDGLLRLRVRDLEQATLSLPPLIGSHRLALRRLSVDKQPLAALLARAGKGSVTHA
ncbi:MAG: ATP-binding cassette domain-containing protein [Coprothermobacterota bacterium]|nr:ATP-binding cassette domain-containing protein [Coprothermobacterota bacterium]